MTSLRLFDIQAANINHLPLWLEESCVGPEHSVASCYLPALCLGLIIPATLFVCAIKEENPLLMRFGQSKLLMLSPVTVLEAVNKCRVQNGLRLSRWRIKQDRFTFQQCKVIKKDRLLLSR